MKQQLRFAKIMMYLVMVCSGSLLAACIRQQIQTGFVPPLLGSALLSFLFTGLACVAITGMEKIDERLTKLEKSGAPDRNNP
jgi:hypothetical protein